MPGIKASRYSFDVKPLAPGKAPYLSIFEAEFESEAALMSAMAFKEGQAVAGRVVAAAHDFDYRYLSLFGAQSKLES